MVDKQAKTSLSLEPTSFKTSISNFKSSINKYILEEWKTSWNTVRHFLLECGDFAQVRNNCFHVDNMKELFQDIHIDSITTF